MKTVALAEVAEVNPRLPERPGHDEAVAFLPMAELNADGTTTGGQARPFGEVAKGYTHFLSGDLLVARITPCFQNGKIGQAALHWPVGVGSTEFHVVRPKPGRVDARYLLHFLRRPEVRFDGERRMTGSGGQRRVPASFIENLELILPPLDEQRRIAVALDRMSRLLDDRREMMLRFDEMAKSIFSDMFGNPVKNELKWPVRAFGEVSETRLGKMLDAKQQTGTDPRPYLRNANVQWFRFELDDVLTMDMDERSRGILRLRNGDVMICEGGQPGRSAVWRGQLEECYFQKALHRARPDPALALPDFLAMMMWFLVQGGGLKDHVTVATISHLTGAKLSAMPIIVPDVHVQRIFADRLDALAANRAHVQASLNAEIKLAATIRARVFSGQT